MNASEVIALVISLLTLLGGCVYITFSITVKLLELQQNKKG